LNKELIKTAIVEYQERELPWLIERNVDVPLESNKIIAITGPRRSGKTYLIYQIIKKLFEKKINKEQILFLSFDDPRLLPIDSKGIELIFEAYRELYPDYSNKVNYIFFDEIQNVKDWEIGIRRIYDTKKFRIFLTGSSSKLLSKEIATQLRGRAITFEIFPFSFKEFLKTKNIELNKKIIYSEERFKIINYLNEFLEFGGFPEVILEKDENIKVRILKDYLETMFFKDLVERYTIRNTLILRELIKFLTTNISSQFSINSFYKWIKNVNPVTKRTIINYVSYLEESGIFHFLRKYSFSLKEQVLSVRKSYIVDLGLRKVYGFKFSDDKGKSLENVVFLELLNHKVKNSLMNIFYYKDYEKHEIDFIVTEGEFIKLLIQSCSNIDDFKTKEREINSLIKASNELKCDNLLIITFDYEDEIVVDGKKIFIKPLWKWLIED